MAINLNAAPYFDDFDPTKGFQRILFKPGVAVQARELTQLQTLLQDNIKSLGNWAITEGTVITGCAETITDVPYIKVNDTDFNGNDVSNLSQVVGSKLYGATSQVSAYVRYVAQGSETDAPDLKALYIDYVGGRGTAKEFLPNEKLTVVEGDGIGRTFVTNNTTSGTAREIWYGKTKRISITEGIVYLAGKFVLVDAQTIFIDTLDTMAGYYSVGWLLSESIVQSGSDQTLLDPAQGSYNHNAPGADRLKYTVNLTSLKLQEYGVELGTEIPDDFYHWIDFKYGAILKVDTKTDPFASLGKEIAKRFYDNSGDYTIRGHKVDVIEHLEDGNGNGGWLSLADLGDSSKLAVTVAPGKSVVQGFPRETYETVRIAIDKSTNYVTKEGIPIGTAYGNYVNIEEVVGVFDVDGGGIVDLYDTAQNKVTAGSGSGTGTASGTKVGTARVRHVTHSDGTAGTAAAVYRLYLYDIKMLSGEFSAVRSIYYNYSGTEAFGDIVLDSGLAEIKETSFNKFLWRLPKKNIRTLRADAGGTAYDYNFQYTKEFDISVGLTGQFTLTLSTDETFPYTSFTQTVIENNFSMVLKGGVTLTPAGLKNNGDWLDLTGATFTLNNPQSLTIDLPDTFSIATNARVYVNVQRADTAPTSKSIVEDRYVKIDTATHVNGTSGTYLLGVADGFRVKEITASSNSDYETGAIDVTNQFIFDNGQGDNYYGHCKIIKKQGATVNLATLPYILVKFDYFTHTSNGASFFCVDSYPVDDTGVSGIKTEEIPLYRSQKYGDFNLKDCVDFRPRMTDTASPTSSVATAPENPSQVQQIDRPADGLTNPVPVEQFSTDLQYYRGRGARVILDGEGNFRVLESDYKDNPVLPQMVPDAMELAAFIIPPYPSLSAAAAKNINRQDYRINIKHNDNRRYTMRDIGQLDQRITRMEYYTALSLLEKNAAELTIRDANNNDRFKNGILVDNFRGHNISAVSDDDFHAAIDPKRQELRPFFNQEQIPLMVSASSATNVLVKRPNVLEYPQLKEGVAMLPYATGPLTAQKQASNYTNLVTELLFNYNGDMVIDPEFDTFVDTSTLPAITANFNGLYDNMVQMADAFGTQWGAWEDVGTASVSQTSVSVDRAVAPGQGNGTADTYTTTTTTQNQQSVGTSLVIGEGGSETQDLGERVVNTSVVPFMRSIIINFNASRLRPNTRVYPFFDGINVSQHCRPAWAGDNDYGDPLLTDASGNIRGSFRVPAGVFRTGNRNFLLVDDAQNRELFITTSTVSQFYSSGLSQQKQGTIVSLRTATVNAVHTTRDRTVTDTSLSFVPGGGTPLPPPTETIIPNPIPVPGPTVYVPPVTVFVPQPSNPVVTPRPTPVPTPIVPPPTGQPPTPEPPTPEPVIPTPVPPTPTPVPPTPEPTDPPPTAEPPPPPPTTDWQSLLDDIMDDFWVNEGAWGMAMDPLAQTFMVQNHPGGCFIDSIDLFFATRSESLGVKLQIREVINGMPGPRVLPFGEVHLNGGQIQISGKDPSTGAAQFVGTRFQFPVPVYLQNNTEYCFVPIPDNDNDSYNVWTATLGENHYGTDQRIDKQPHGGMMFSSANNRTWTPRQGEDMMFQINKCIFQTGSKTLRMVNKPYDWMSFENWSFDAEKFEPGTILHAFDPTVDTAGAGYTSAPTVTITGGGGSGATATATVNTSTGELTGITITNPGVGYISAPTVSITGGGATTDATASLDLKTAVVREWNTLYSYATAEQAFGAFTFNVGDLIGSSVGYASLSSLTDKIVDAFVITNGALQTNNTTIRSSIAWTQTGSIAAGTEFDPADIGFTTELENQKTIYSRSNEVDTYSGNKTFNMDVVLSSSSSNVSPMVDVAAVTALCFKNDINNTTNGEDGRRGGDSASRYISRRVTLDEGQDAEDMQVFLANKLPEGANVYAYFKGLNSNDPGVLTEDAHWVPLELEAKPEDTTDDFIEYVYSIPEKTSLGGGAKTDDAGVDPVTGVFEYDVHVISSIAVTNGGSGYTSQPTVTITHSGGYLDGYGATATADVNTGTGQITAINIEDPGRDYKGGTVTVTITGGGGSSATATATQSITTYKTYKQFAIKVVPTASNTAQVPKIKDLRAIALQV